MEPAIPYSVEARPDTGLFNAKIGIWLFLSSEVMLFGALFSSYILLRVGAEPGTWVHGLLNIPIGTINTAVLITSSVTVVLSWASLKMGQFARYRRLQVLTLACAACFLGLKSFEYREKFGHYEVWLKDGRRYLGHIDLNGRSPLFWNTRTLELRNIESIQFRPEPYHYTMSPKEMALAKKAAAGKGPSPLTIKTAEIKRLSAFVPAHSTYFAAYVTLTGLHALHVLGGALVIGYLWGPGARMWRVDPERYTNRIEVSGLFWHFVDMVWIFLFPVLYLL